jgi:hypothetical protein
MRSAALLSLLPALALGAPVIQARDGKVIPGSYIVMLKESDGVTATSEEFVSLLSTVEKSHDFTSLNGFAAELTEEQLESLKNSPEVG